jgi:hypothetical protein
VVLLFRDNLDPDLAPFKAAAPLGIGKFVSFVRGFNFAVPAHPLGEGNVALVVVRNGSVSTHWVRGKDAHYRVSSGVASVCVGGGGGGQATTNPAVMSAAAAGGGGGCRRRNKTNGALAAPWQQQRSR